MLFLVLALLTGGVFLAGLGLAPSRPGIGSGPESTLVTTNGEEMSIGQVIRFDLDPEVARQMPTELPLFPIQPASSDLFSPEGLQGLAQTLGFTDQATAVMRGHLISYTEGPLKLLVQTQAGTIQLNSSLTKLAERTGPIEPVRARQALQTSLSGFGLWQDFFGWPQATIESFTLRDGSPQPTALVSEQNFAQLKTQLKVEFERGSFELRPPHPTFAWVDPDYQIVALSVWFPNLQTINPIYKERVGIEQTQARVLRGEGVIRYSAVEAESLVVTGVEIFYQVLPDEILDFSQVRYLRPFYRFYGEQGEVLVEAT